MTAKTKGQEPRSQYEVKGAARLPQNTAPAVLHYIASSASHTAHPRYPPHPSASDNQSRLDLPSAPPTAWRPRRTQSGVRLRRKRGKRRGTVVFSQHYRLGPIRIPISNRTATFSGLFWGRQVANWKGSCGFCFLNDELPASPWPQLGFPERDNPRWSGVETCRARGERRGQSGLETGPESQKVDLIRSSTLGLQ